MRSKNVFYQRFQALAYIKKFEHGRYIQVLTFFFLYNIQVVTFTYSSNNNSGNLHFHKKEKKNSGNLHCSITINEGKQIKMVHEDKYKTYKF